MKVVCDRERLREALAVVNNIVPAKSPKPVLENVCLVATDDGLEVLGTDLECSVRYRVSAVAESEVGEKPVAPAVRVDEAGIAVIPARVALDFVRDLAATEVVLSAQDQACTIQGGEDRCELVTVDPDEFPVIASFAGEATLAVQAGAFVRLVGRTAFAAAREAGRYAMHGVLMEVEDSELRLVATDGRRLAMASSPTEIRSGSQRTRPAIVPTKGMQLFCRVVGDPLEQVQVHLGENQVGIKTARAEVFARLIDGEFPRYAAVIPRETTNHCEANAETLARKLRLVANVTGHDARSVKLTLAKGQLELASNAAGRGHAHAHMEVTYKGTPAEIAFNPDFLLDGIKNCEGGTVKLDFSDRTSPGRFTLGENYIYVVMPITVDA
jgi:DNA polymerase-3 subunit beta